MNAAATDGHQLDARQAESVAQALADCRLAATSCCLNKERAAP
eukprot:CAMPEP_0183363034 /NCGR_PEP_ID=MMETSP0164_2-20130417/73017_1 /TAXON_ID=221442 /ORGANISM="Coccolithus pelagicus ssp braarudi, Strain PLY182g" /LENGTH=42 /DNA_ID= /DNA_START= /DNA_END= /DNA_ORIENTATION=